MNWREKEEMPLNGFRPTSLFIPSSFHLWSREAREDLSLVTYAETRTLICITLYIRLGLASATLRVTRGWFLDCHEDGITM